MMTLSHIDRVYMHPPLLCVLNMVVDNLTIVVKFLVVYHQDKQIMFQILQKNQHNNISFKADLFYMIVLVEKTGKGIKKL